MAQDLYKKATGFSRTEILGAQQRLMTITVGLALQELYTHVKEQGDKIENPTVILEPKLSDRVRLALYHGARPCETADETMDALLDVCSSQYDLVLAYNQLAAHYKFDLSLKTAGNKTAESILEKQIRDNHKGDNIDRDYVRVTAISSDLQLLQSFEKKHSAKIDENNRNNNNKGRFYKDKGWRLTNRAHLQRTVYKEIGGVGCELFLAPRDQAEVVSRITHKYFDVVRSWDAYKKEKLPEKRKIMIEQYNTVTEKLGQMLGALSLKGEVTKPILREFNAMLATGDASTATLDPGGEKGNFANDVEGIKSTEKGHQKYSPIFESEAELKAYGDYLISTAQKLNLKRLDELLPRLRESDSDDTIKEKIMNLVPVAQVTHTSGMRHAPKNFRALWAACAFMANNKAPKGVTMIDALLVDDILKGHGPAAGEPITKDEISDEIAALKKQESKLVYISGRG